MEREKIEDALKRVRLVKMVSYLISEDEIVDFWHEGNHVLVEVHFTPGTGIRMERMVGESFDLRSVNVVEEIGDFISLAEVVEA